MLNGSCLCGAVAFTVEPNDASTACHCTQCRKQTGHFWASGHADVAAFEISGDVTWFDASDIATRGFCATCGSFLFWRAHTEQKMSFSLGAIDGETGLPLKRHIFVGDKGDYYDIADDVPQRMD